MNEWSVPEEKAAYAAFSGSKVAAGPSASADGATGHHEDAQVEVMFSKSGTIAMWTPTQGTLLEFAEVYGLGPADSCRAGVCLIYVCALRDGEVEYSEPPTGTPD